MASVKKAKPSSENGRPMIGPACSMKRGNKRPSSNESTVPDTAPIAKRMAVPFAQRFESESQRASRVRRYIASANTMSTGMPIPIIAKTMWKPSETANWDRARRAASMWVPLGSV